MSESSALTRWGHSVASKTRRSIGRLANRAGVPGAVTSVDLIDGADGPRFAIKVGNWYTVVSVGNRDYYFNRLTGRFDGTGSTIGCAPPNIVRSP